MQQKNLTNTLQEKTAPHVVRVLASATHWVVDSKPLKPGKFSITTAHAGCNTDGCSGAPSIKTVN